MSAVTRPAYRTSKQALWASMVLAWVVILALTVGAVAGVETAVAFGAVALPSMVAMIVAILGLHRAFGSLDYRAAAQASRAYDPRADPEAGA